jgi:uncharacterized membrane protein (DUF485 family)
VSNNLPPRGDVPVAVLAALAPATAAAAPAETNLVTWLILGAIALFVVAIVLRMVFAARFPRGYAGWARRRRDKFAARRDAWEREERERESE